MAPLDAPAVAEGLRSLAVAVFEPAGEAVGEVERAVTVCFEMVPTGLVAVLLGTAAEELGAAPLADADAAAEPEEKKMLCEVPVAIGTERVAEAVADPLAAGVEAAPETVKELTGEPA